MPWPEYTGRLSGGERRAWGVGGDMRWVRMEGEGRVLGATSTKHFTQSLYSATLLSHSPHHSLLEHTLFTHTCLARSHTGIHHTAPHRTTPHHTAPRRTTPHHTAPHRTTQHRAARHKHRAHRLHSKSQAKGVVWSSVFRSWSIKHICAVTPAHHLSVTETVEDLMPLERWGRCGGAGRKGYECEGM